MLATPTGWAQQNPAGDDVNAERTRFVEKVKEVNRWGPEAPIVADATRELDKSIAEGRDLILYLGPGLVKDHRAYRLNWTKKVFSFVPLTPEEAAKAEVKETSMSVHHGETTTPAAPQPGTAVVPTPSPTTAALPHEYMISNLVIGDPPHPVEYGKPFPVKLRIQRSSISTPAKRFGVSVRINGAAPGNLSTWGSGILEGFTPPEPGGETELVFEVSEVCGNKVNATRNGCELRACIVKPDEDMLEVVSNELRVPLRIAP
jgi:hypothetical protein